MSDEFGSLLDENEKIPSISWRDAEVGQKLVLRIEELPTKRIHRSKFGDKSVKLYWKQTPEEAAEGKPKRPMENTFTGVTVLEGSDTWTTNKKKKQTDPAQKVGERRNWWVNLPSQPLAELSRLHGWMKREHHRGLKVGDVIEVTLSDKVEIDGKPDYDLQNIFDMKYVRNESTEQTIFDE